MFYMSEKVRKKAIRKNAMTHGLFINVFSFLHVKVNSRKICEEISLPFFRKMLPSAVFFEIQG